MFMIEMAKGSPVLSVRIPVELLALVDEVIARSAATRKDGPWTRSSFIVAAIEQYCPGADGNGIYMKGFERWNKWCAEQSGVAEQKRNPLYTPPTSTLLPKIKRPTGNAARQPQSTANKPSGT